MESPSHSAHPSGVLPQCCHPSVNVGIFVLLRQKASPVVVRWCTSPVPRGSGNSQETGAPMASPIRDFRSANPNWNSADWPRPQYWASCADAPMGTNSNPKPTSTADGVRGNRLMPESVIQADDPVKVTSHRCRHCVIDGC